MNCTCGRSAQWWRPTASRIDHSSFCSLNEVAEAAAEMTAEDEYDDVEADLTSMPPIHLPVPPPASDRALTYADAEQLMAQAHVITYDDGIHYGRATPLTLDGTAFVLHSSFDIYREGRHGAHR